MFRRLSIAATVALLIACGGPTDPADLPQLPVIALDGISPTIQADIDTAMRAVDDAPTDAGRNGKLAMTLAAYDFTEPAEVAYQRARLLAPRDPKWAYGHAHLLAWQGKVANAIEILRPLAKRNPRNDRIALKLAELLRTSGEHADARAIYERIVERNPGAFEAHYGLGQLGLSDGDAPSAVTHLETAIGLQRGVGDLHYALAQAYRQVKNPEAAASQTRLYEQFKQVKVAEFDPWALSIAQLNQSDRMHMRRAQRHFERKDYAKAVTELERALAKNADNVSAHTHLVWLLGQQNDMESARRHYEQGLAIDDQFAQLHVNWATILTRQKRFAEAEPVLRRAVATDSSNAEPQAQLGYVLEELGRVDEGIAQYRLALNLDSGHRRANYLLGRQLALAGHSADAVTYLERSTERNDRQTPIYLRTLAGVYDALGRRDDAIKALERALIQIPPQSDIASALREEVRALREASARGVTSR